tara:strand:+ start:208 stop:426 length:219 start_codon:yes stop_codon:yes gene_type:complete
MDDWGGAVTEAFNWTGHVFLDVLEPYVHTDLIVLACVGCAVWVWLNNARCVLRNLRRARALGQEVEGSEKEQ